MVAERPGLTWKAWALEGADAGRLLNGRDRLSTGYSGYKLQTDAQVTHQPRPAQTEMPSHANQRKSHGENHRGGPWRELIAVSPSNETKRSTAASSGPQSPRYEGEPHHDGIAVWRDTQSLAESLGVPSAPSPRRSFKGRSPATSPLRQGPPSASLLSDRVQAWEMTMPPWMSTLGLSNASQASHPSPSHNFAEAALGRLAWLQAEKEALEGWLSNAGYLSMDKENEIHRSHRTNDHSISSDVKMHSEAFQHSEAEPVMERHVERIGAMALNHLSQERHSEMLGSIETNEHDRRAASRRTSVLEERNYQALATERAAAEAKLRKDLRAVALERWSEPLNAERQDSHKGLGEQHGIVQPRNSAPPSGVREIQAFRAFPEAEPSHTPAASLANDGRRESRLPRGSGNLAAVVNQPGTYLGRRGSSQASVVEESSASRHSSPARGQYSSMTATRRHTEAGWNQPYRAEVPTLHPRHSSPPLSPGSQAAGSRLPRGHSPSLQQDGHLYGSRRSSQDVHTAQPQSSDGSFGRQKAPSFSWPGTSSFTAEVKHPSTTRKASVSSVYQPSSLGRARAATEAGLPSDRSRQRFLSVPDVSDTRRLSHNTGGSASRHNTPPRNGELEAPRHESEGSETSSSESPEEAAQRQAQVEHDLQELAARLQVPRPPRPKPLRKGSVGTVPVSRSTVPGGPIDLLALAAKTKSEAGRALGAGEEVECRPAWRRTIVDSEIAEA